MFRRLKKILGKIKSGAYYDYPLLFCVILLLLLGVVMVYSASRYTEGNDYLIKQLIYGTGAFVGMFVISKVFDYHILNHKLVAGGSYLLAVLSVGFIMLFGKSFNGSTRWLSIAGISIQPSEFCKLLIMIPLAYYLTKNSHKLNKYLPSLIPMVMVSPAILVVLIDDLSTALVITAICGVMVFTVSEKPLQLIGSAFALLGLLVVYILIMKAGDYQANRITVWLNPDTAGDRGIQVMESLYSVATGGFFGKGLGMGMVKLGHLSEAFNDMIFSVICEELGIFGGLAVIIIYLFLIWRIVRIAINAPDIFGSLICIGVAVHVSVQVLFHIGVCTNFFPNTGMTLPFISAGGSSILVLATELGIVLAISRMIGVKTQNA